ncbi:site-specific DNA-methyltransferase [Bacillus sp. FJAT-50079]|uniref:DNA-methyltransferase n=1 Tax=Bacillus sp. FJAT-50079 TaxID=2833577 RepID=UPI001BC98CF7|nr:site-specific DNA-methyltransferase [Bacillus sp. FJAT-50079]MBS4207128.1 site-specific DNA-methyltransferase [Bacillus sp. FJAT-50079]
MFENKLFSVLNIKDNDALKNFAKKVKIPVGKLKYYNNEAIFPYYEDLNKILSELNISELEFKLSLGVLDSTILDLISNKAKEITDIIKSDSQNGESTAGKFKPVFTTELGELYNEDSLSLIKSLPKESVDLIFADPPFNLNKTYESNINDKLTKEEYLKWTEEWILGCIKLLKEGGSFFIWNLPLWNTYSAEILNKHLNLRHWIAVDIKYSLPIANKLYPSHYSLLYYIKGEKPNTFNQERLPLEICKRCGGDIKDYGGYKDKLNEKGLTLPDVWKDISPVRHRKYKTRGSNQLPVNLLERIISMASNEGDVVFDPFGGSGTTYIVSEILKRQWIGSEIGPCDLIIKRFDDIDFHRQQIKDIQSKKNVLFTEDMKKIRIKNGHWLPETLKTKESSTKIDNKEFDSEVNLFTIS